MQMITHFLVGIIIQKFLFGIIPFPFDIILILILAFLSHILVDCLARLTYHTPDPQKGDKIWLSWHVVIYVTSFLVFIIFCNPYWLVMIVSILFDIWDWYTLRMIQRHIKKDPNWGKKYFLHPIIDKVRSRFFMWLPDLTYNHKGILVEIVIIISLLCIILFL